MKVKELIVELQKLEQNTDVICYCEDEHLENEEFQLIFEILSVLEQKVERVRVNHKPAIKFVDLKNPENLAVIEITNDI